MRLALLTLFAMAVTALAAVFFVHTIDAPVRAQGNVLGKYSAGWRTALLVGHQPVVAPSPLTNVTIINATSQ
jgi:hypothetical protein